MGAVYKKELKSYFSNMTGYISVALILMLAVPIVTMKSFAEERHQKTDLLLYTLPLKTSQIVLGKYLAMITVVAIPCVILGFYPLILRSFGNVPLGTAYGTLLAFFLLSCTLSAVGMLISSLTDNQAVAAGLCFVVMLLLYFMNSLAGFISDSDSLLCTVMESLSVFERFYTFVNGVFDLTAVLYFGSIIGVCLFVTVQMMEKRRWNG